MDKQNKFKQLLKKEGFYVALFLCICVVATATAIGISSNKVSKGKDVGQVQGQNTSENKNPDNALFVKGEENLKEKQEVELHKSGKTLASVEEGETSAVSNKENAKFSKPAEGNVAQGYSEVPVLQQTAGNDNSKVYKTNFGIDIESELGNKVLASAEGVVEVVGVNPKGHGNMIVIDHKNGYKTVYSNLDSEVLVAEGDSVKEGQEIGKVGDTTLRTLAVKSSENNDLNKINHLHFAILEGTGSFEELDYNNNYINPEKFIAY